VYAPGIFQYGAGVIERCSASRKVSMAAFTTGEVRFTLQVCKAHEKGEKEDNNNNNNNNRKD